MADLKNPSSENLRQLLKTKTCVYAGDINKVIEKTVEISLSMVGSKANTISAWNSCVDDVAAKVRIVALDWFYDTYGLVLNEPVNHQLSYSLFVDLKNAVLDWLEENWRD